MIQKFKIFILFVLLSSSLFTTAGCSNLSFSKPTETATLRPTIRPPKPTRTPTPLPTKTELPTNTPTITPTPTLLPPVDDFSKARLYSFGPRPGWDFGITIQLPDEIKGEYDALVDDPPKKFTCRPLVEYNHPERLYCVGRIPAVDENILFKVVERSTGQVVFKGYVYSPLP
ncbi:hypothetical protein [Leptolinea tardivitalis]|uniref:Lipoprotein n=1 Tax=Leptolinea tardivitalis TaxID=229920 RepID=A0A0P6WRA5_9CHLR|nr:hypothetical protein [Leptolinea tardivitalis]KPL72612.1 hypothetical protein ADM99_05765 [Leptolinea tardivitalis]GAP21071.1 hypothetical protein LTAR_01277 [Leptolinea tardivitalis]